MDDVDAEDAVDGVEEPPEAAAAAAVPLEDDVDEGYEADDDDPVAAEPLADDEAPDSASAVASCSSCAKAAWAALRFPAFSAAPRFCRSTLRMFGVAPAVALPGVAALVPEVPLVPAAAPAPGESPLLLRAYSPGR